MSDRDAITAFKNYLAAFVEPHPAERELLLRHHVDEDVVFSNPGVNSRGLDKLLGHISAFQDRFPGGTFRINWLRQQHGRVLAEWTQLHEDGSEFITAHSYAEIGEDGRITHFAGFWE